MSLCNKVGEEAHGRALWLRSPEPSSGMKTPSPLEWLGSISHFKEKNYFCFLMEVLTKF